MPARKKNSATKSGNSANRKGGRAGASKRRAPNTETAKPSQRFRVIGTSLVALIFLSGLYTLARVDLPQPAARHSNTDANQRASNNSKPMEYTYHSRLADFEVEVNEKARPRNGQSPYSYLIQAGSFKTLEQAERRIVELKLLGLDPRVDQRINDNGSKWQRVLLGPFDSRSRMSSVRSALLSNDIDAMVMKKRNAH